MKKLMMIMILVVTFLSMAGSSVIAQEESAGVVDPVLLDQLIYLGKDSNSDGDISIAEMQAITGELNLMIEDNSYVSGNGYKGPIDDITGLEYAINMTGLNLYGNNISDVSPISSLSALQTLNLGENNITSIAGFDNLTNITTLNIFGNHVSDISPISNLTTLQYLYIDRNEISDISYVAGLTNLEVLVFDENQVSDISPISNLTLLWGLSMDDNKISDISPLASLENIRRLELTKNEISEVTQLSGLTNLERLDLDYNTISDISPIANLTNLDHLSINYNVMSDISSLSGFPSLRMVELDGNNITHIPLLTGLPNLILLDLGENGIVDISNISTNFPNLERLFLNQNNITDESDLSDLSNITTLTSLNLQGNNISDITDLFGFNNLTHLDLTLNGFNRTVIPDIQTILTNNPGINRSNNPGIGLLYNIIPNRIDTVSETTTASTYIGNSYDLDLATIFEDADADSLTYKVSVNGGNEIDADENYTYMASVSGTMNFVFQANDSKENSTDLYRVQLTVKPIQPAPDVPTMASHTSTSITLNTVIGCEYSIDGSTWVTTREFNGLTENTSYSLYQRRMETTTYGPSTSSSASFSTRQRAVSSLEMIASPTTTDYVANETLNLSGLEVKIHYDDHSYDTLYWYNAGYATSPTVTDILTISDDGEVTVSFEGKSTTFIINVERADYVGMIIDPVIDSKTHNSIILRPVDGYEYSSDNGATWSASNVFTGLSPDTTYVFVQRVKQTYTYKPSANSSTLSIVTEQAPANALLGTVTISGNSMYNDELTALVSNDNKLGELAYQWQADNVDISGATSVTYILTESEIGSVITCEVRDTDIGSGERTEFIESIATTVVDKLTLATPQAPTKQSSTTTSITLSPTAGYEYRKDGQVWQDSNVFSNLSASTTYTFTQRVKGTTTTYESIESPTATISTSSPSSTGSTSGLIPDAKTIDNSKKGEDVTFTIEQEDIKVSFNGLAFEGLDHNNIQAKIEEVDKDELDLPDEFKEQIGDLPIFDISIYVDGEKEHFESDEPIIIEIPVDTDLENHKVVAVYIDDNGAIQIMEGVLINGVMRFTTNHLSNYALMYVDKTFEDIAGHWGQLAIEALASREVIEGRSDTVFDPYGEITRAEFVTLMVRYFNLTSDSHSNYSDVEADKWYTDSIAVALANHILPSMYGDIFEPKKAIRRDEMMYILYKALEITGKLDSLETGNDTLEDFADSNSIADYAATASDYLVKAGIINGSGNGNLNPTYTSTRAEVAQMLYNLLIKLDSN